MTPSISPPLIVLLTLALNPSGSCSIISATFLLRQSIWEGSRSRSSWQAMARFFRVIRGEQLERSRLMHTEPSSSMFGWKILGATKTQLLQLKRDSPPAQVYGRSLERVVRWIEFEREGVSTRIVQTLLSSRYQYFHLVGGLLVVVGLDSQVWTPLQFGQVFLQSSKRH